MEQRRHVMRAALAVMAGLWLLARAGSAVKLTLWALVAAYLLDVPVSALEKKMGRGAASAIVLAGALLLVAGLLGAVLVPALMQLARLPFFLAAAKGSAGFGKLGRFMGEITGLMASYGGKLVSAAVRACASLGARLTGLAAVCALTVFALMDWQRISLRLALFVPSRWRARAVGAARAVRRDLGGFLRGQLTVVCAVSALRVTALWAAGAPLPLAMGVMYGALNAIPYVGPLLATVPPVAASLAAGWQRAGLTLLILLLVQQIDNYVISPRVLGAASGMGPLAVLMSIAVGSALGGVGGMFLALPAAVAGRSVYRVFVEGAESDE